MNQPDDKSKGLTVDRQTRRPTDQPDDPSTAPTAAPVGEPHPNQISFFRNALPIGRPFGRRYHYD